MIITFWKTKRQIIDVRFFVTNENKSIHYSYFIKQVQEIETFEGQNISSKIYFFFLLGKLQYFLLKSF